MQKRTLGMTNGYRFDVIQPDQFTFQRIVLQTVPAYAARLMNEFSEYSQSGHANTLTIYSISEAKSNYI